MDCARGFSRSESVENRKWAARDELVAYRGRYDILVVPSIIGTRADGEDDPFSFPESAGKVHTLVQCGLSGMEGVDHSKLAEVHKRDIPWYEPSEDS